MSKSKGNDYTLGDLVAKGYSPAALRYALLAGHPRKQLNFTLDSMHAAESALKTLYGFEAILRQAAGAAPARGTRPSVLFDEVLGAIRTDLNAPAALGALFTTINTFDPATATAADVLAFDVVKYAFGFRQASGAREIPPAVQSLARHRWEAKLAKDFATADRLRQELAAAGWSMRDGKSDFVLEPHSKT